MPAAAWHNRTMSDANPYHPPTADQFAAYYHSTPPWEIGRPQQPFLAVRDQVRGRVLDAGCGTGELALMAAADGHDATGIDGASSAIDIARTRAAERGLAVTFLVGDVMELADHVTKPFDTVLDSGLLHVFDPMARARYVAQLGAVTAIGGEVMLLCFSDRQPGTDGPYRLSREDLHTAFVDGWHVASIEPARFVGADLPDVSPSAEAWFARIQRR